MSLISFPRQFTVDPNGLPREGALAYFYQNGTSTPIDIWADTDLSIDLSNPVESLSSGYFPAIYVDGSVNPRYKIVVKDSAGVTIYNEDDVETPDIGLRADLADDGSNLISWTRTATSAIVKTLQKALDSNAVNVFDFLTDAQIADVQAGTLTIDLANPIQAAHAAAAQVYYPPGKYRSNSTITLNRGAHVRGANCISTDIYFYGCNGFELDEANGRSVRITGVSMRSNDSGGVADPRAFHAIVCPGTAINVISSFRADQLFLQGWSRCFDWSYVISSFIDHVETANCDIGVRLFGQCLNNFIADSILVVNGGTAAIQTVKDGVIQSEGLAVSNTTLAGDLASGTTRGVVSDGFLLMSFNNCIADLFPGRAFDMTDCKGLSFQGGWVYSKKQCFAANDLGSAADQGWSINTYATTADANEDLLYWGTNNKGLSWNGGQATVSTAGTGRIARFSGSEVYMSGVHLLNATSNASIYVNNTDVNIGTNTGANTVEYNVSQVPTTASAATLVLPRRSNVHLISGTTNITSITATGWDGEVITLIFLGILTLTDGGNIKLSANFVTTADDAIQLACASGNWYQVAPGSAN